MSNKNWIVFKSNQKKPESEIAFEKLSKKNQEAINKWLYERGVISKSETRAGNRKRAIIKLLTFIGKDYDQITYDDYVSIASAISNSSCGTNQRNGDRNFIARFIKDNYDNWQVRFKELKLLKSEVMSEEKKLKNEDLLTDSEIERIITNTSDMKKKALIAVLAASAARPEEILKLKWNDVDFKNKLIYLYSIKTKRKRHIPINPAISHLERLKAEQGSSDEDLVFPSISGGIVTNAGFNYMLHELAKKAGIKKRVYGKLFRHTRLTFLITKVSPKVYEEIAGHSLQTGMKIYAHLSQDAIIKEMKEKVFPTTVLSQNEENELKKKVENLTKLGENQNELLSLLIRERVNGEKINPHELAEVYTKLLGKRVEVVEVPKK